MVLFLAALGAQATILLQDDFTYADGSLTNVSSGKWATFSGNAGGTPVSGGVLYNGQNYSDDVLAALAGGPYTSSSTSNYLYFSFTLNAQALPTNSGGYYFALYGSSVGFRSRVYAFTNTAAPGKFRLGVANSAGSPATNTTDLSLGTTYTVVGRFLLTNSTATLWINPVSSASLNVSATDATTSAGITNFSFRQPGGAPAANTTAAGATFAIDNLLVGTAFADVVPGSVNPPTVLIQPNDTNVVAGSTISFTTLADGDGPISYQWQTNGVNIAGGTSATLTLANVTVAQSGNYYCQITGASGVTNTRVNTVVVSAVPVPPSISTQPQNQTVTAGDIASFTVVAAGSNPLSYQWKSVSGGVTNNIAGSVTGTNTATVTFPIATLAQSGNYVVIVTNAFGTNSSVQVTLTVNPPPVVTIGNLRSRVDNVNYAPTNTTSFFTTTGTVTTYNNMTSGSVNYEFFIQDNTGGIAVFWAASAANNSLPRAGDIVQVTGPLAQFNGLLELSPTTANALTSVTVLSSGNPLPAPQVLPFDPSVTANPAIMEALEGSYCVASNVFLDATAPTFVSGANFLITNSLNQTFDLFVNANTDIPGQTKPTGPVTVYGILGQFIAAAPFTSGYEFTPSRLAEFVGPVTWTNVLSRLVRRGDAPTNTYTESVLRPGEKLVMTVTGADPAGGSVTVTPVDTGVLSANSSWTTPGAVTGASAANTFTFQPTAADAGSNYVVTLEVDLASGTSTNIWNIYVPTADEQQVVISEFFANPTTNVLSHAFNPLGRALDTNSTITLNDQYIEIANLSGSSFDLFNWKVNNGTVIKKTFDGSTSGQTLSSSNYVVLFGSPTTDLINPPSIGQAFVSDVSGGVALKSSGGTLMLHNQDGHLIDRVVYTSSDLSTNVSSMSRFPTINDGFVPQAYINTNLVTAGAQYDGGSWSANTKVPAAVTNVVLAAGNPITLSFTADPTLASTLWQSDSVTNKFHVVFGQQFGSPSGVFSVTNPPPVPNKQFWFITTQ